MSVGVVRRAVLLWNDEIERLAERLRGGEAEELFGARAPELNPSRHIRDHDRRTLLSEQ